MPQWVLPKLQFNELIHVNDPCDSVHRAANHRHLRAARVEPARPASNAKLGPNQKRFERDTDMLNGRFSEKAQIICEIKDYGEVVIDLDKPPTG
jgi:hypothetical protein